MLTLRPANERGHANHGWLDTRFTFSFADYRDPNHMGFRTLRVINDDRIAAGQGFGTHGHQDMEILTFVLEGAVAHKDSMGNVVQVPAGELQRMTAGRGVMHSEFNPSPDEELHLLQIWILPETKGLEPGYEQKAFQLEAQPDRLHLIASRDGRGGSLTIHQDADVHAAFLRPGATVTHTIAAGRGVWIHVAEGAMMVNGEHLVAGDGAAITEDATITITGEQDGRVLLFDLA